MFEKFNDIIDAENLNEQQILDLYSDIIEAGYRIVDTDLELYYYTETSCMGQLGVNWPTTGASGIIRGCYAIGRYDMVGHINYVRSGCTTLYTGYMCK